MPASRVMSRNIVDGAGACRAAPRGVDGNITRATVSRSGSGRSEYRGIIAGPHQASNVPPHSQRFDSLLDAAELLLIKIEIAAGAGVVAKPGVDEAQLIQHLWRIGISFVGVQRGRRALRHSAAVPERRGRRRGWRSRWLARAQRLTRVASWHCRSLRPRFGLRQRRRRFGAVRLQLEAAHERRFRLGKQLAVVQDKPSASSVRARSGSRRLAASQRVRLPPAYRRSPSIQRQADSDTARPTDTCE